MRQICVLVLVLLACACGGGDGPVGIVPSDTAKGPTPVFKVGPSSLAIVAQHTAVAHYTVENGQLAFADLEPSGWGFSIGAGDTLLIRAGASVNDADLQSDGSFIHPVCFIAKGKNTADLNPQCISTLVTMPTPSSNISLRFSRDTIFEAVQYTDTVTVSESVFVARSPGGKWHGTGWMEGLFGSVRGTTYLSPTMISVSGTDHGGGDHMVGFAFVNPSIKGSDGGVVCKDIMYITGRPFDPALDHESCADMVKAGLIPANSIILSK